ncbi:MAG TPA: hypothetical protein VHU83_05635 [Bryobacteraceae bacterium]|jgi:hypothetical protein|nr:hypothetical protein [Bryobacteraceae bacterium]
MATPAQVAANQANSQKSTGPASPSGKARSSRNSFKHGLYSKELVLPNEDPAELDRLRASLRAEHQPIDTTEDILVNDLAENFWRLRRMREFETRAMLPENIFKWHESGLLAVVQRTMASAERGFHKSLTALRRLQKDRGFVPQESAEPSAETSDPADETGFVSQQSELLAEAKASVIAEMRPFLNESGSLTREGAQKFAAHMREKCLRQFDQLPKAA